MYTASIVNYYNTTPFLFGINQSEIKKELIIELDIPSACAQKLKNKQVDIGLVPVAILPELDQYHIITDYCIGAHGKVDSVKLFSQKPLEELTHIILDYQSKTSVTLVQVLNKHFWKKNIQFVNGTEGFETQISDTTGAVIIGDRTFGLTGYQYEYDLSEEWHKHTGLPFVFACWVSSEVLDTEFIINFNKALAHGIHHIDEAIADKPIHIKGFDATDYLKNKISYPLNEDKKKSLHLFFELMK